MSKSDRLSASEWEKRLSETFAVNGTIGVDLESVLVDEADIGQFLLEKFHGQNVLLSSFQSFFLDTLRMADAKIASDGWPKDLPHYTLAIAVLSNLFRRFRACEILFVRGYPLDAYALMRDIKDRAIMLAGIASNRTTFAEAFGAKEDLTPDQEGYGKATTENRKKASNRLSAEFIGKSSGLSLDVQHDLKRWDNLFHLEVHNAFLSFTHDINAIYREGKLPALGPTRVVEAYAIYMNRRAEIGWMIVRLLPFLQLSEGTFGAEWLHKQQVLDDSFRYMAEGLAGLGKRIGHSFIAMMDKKFRFKKSFHYFESTYHP